MKYPPGPRATDAGLSLSMLWNIREAAPACWSAILMPTLSLNESHEILLRVSEVITQATLARATVRLWLMSTAREEGCDSLAVNLHAVVCVYVCVSVGHTSSEGNVHANTLRLLATAVQTLDEAQTS